VAQVELLQPAALWVLEMEAGSMANQNPFDAVFERLADMDAADTACAPFESGVRQIRMMNTESAIAVTCRTYDKRASVGQPCNL
jgi:hypothetical protein